MSERGRGDRGPDRAPSRPGIDPSRSGGDLPPGPPLAADVFDAMPVGVALFGPDGRLRHANPVLTDLLGAGIEALRGRTLAELVDEAEQDMVEERLDELAAGRINAFECLLVGVARRGARADAGRSGPTSPPRTAPTPASTAWWSRSSSSAPPAPRRRFPPVWPRSSRRARTSC